MNKEDVGKTPIFLCIYQLKEIRSFLIVSQLIIREIIKQKEIL